MSELSPATGVDELVRALVRIPSESGNEQAVAKFAADWLTQRGLDVQLIGLSIFAKLEGSGSASVLLNSHLDTVPAGEAWSADPWDVDWRDGRLTGLGANDAKGCAASMMWAAAALAQRPAEERPGELWLALNEREETTNAGMHAVLEHCGLPDAAVTGEPTGLEVVRAQAGLAVLIAKWRGRSCHAAHVSRVEHTNAMLDAARELGGLPQPWVLAGEHPLLGPSTLTPTVLHAGDRHNRVPDLAECTFDARLAAPHDAAECVALLREKMPKADITVRSERLRAVETADEHAFVRAALECAGKGAAIGSNTLSDMALLPGVPAVKCGPGMTVRSHTPDEFITRDELAAGAAFYERVVPAAWAALAAEVSTR